VWRCHFLSSHSMNINIIKCLVPFGFWSFCCWLFVVLPFFIDVPCYFVLLHYYHQKQREYFLHCAHPHCWTSMNWSMIMIHLLKNDNFDSNILLLQHPNRHLNSMALIIWTTKDQALILISSIIVNKLFYVASSSYPIIKFPYYINSTTSTWFSLKN
jgi:hypothetical protein